MGGGGELPSKRWRLVCGGGAPNGDRKRWLHTDNIKLGTDGGCEARPTASNSGQSERRRDAGAESSRKLTQARRRVTVVGEEV
jgi:hypothetical protein